MARAKRSFSVEFRERAVAYVVDQHKSIAGAARELGIGESTLANWIKTAETGRSGEGLVLPVERDEMRRLRAENRELQMRVELLKKATAYFASETQN
ncbi:MAG: transposase [Actinomycetota bacterium]|nr:transposase [Actinomycetota bacterium]